MPELETIDLTLDEDSCEQAASDVAQGEGPSCPICLQDIINCPTDIANVVPCKHLFCVPCLTAWASRKRVCPLCKGPIRGYYQGTDSGGQLEVILPPEPPPPPLPSYHVNLGLGSAATAAEGAAQALHSLSSALAALYDEMEQRAQEVVAAAIAAAAAQRRSVHQLGAGAGSGAGAGGSQPAGRLGALGPAGGGAHLHYRGSDAGPSGLSNSAGAGGAANGAAANRQPGGGSNNQLIAYDTSARALHDLLAETADAADRLQGLRRRRGWDSTASNTRAGSASRDGSGADGAAAGPNGGARGGAGSFSNLQQPSDQVPRQGSGSLRPSRWLDGRDPVPPGTSSTTGGARGNTEGRSGPSPYYLRLQRSVAAGVAQRAAAFHDQHLSQQQHNPHIAPSAGTGIGASAAAASGSGAGLPPRLPPSSGVLGSIVNMAGSSGTGAGPSPALGFSGGNQQGAAAAGGGAAPGENESQVAPAAAAPGRGRRLFMWGEPAPVPPEDAQRQWRRSVYDNNLWALPSGAAAAAGSNSHPISAAGTAGNTLASSAGTGGIFTASGLRSTSGMGADASGSLGAGSNSSNNPHVRGWVERELQALLGDGDGILAAYVLGLLSSGPGPGSSTSNTAAAGMGSAQNVYGSNRSSNASTARGAGSSSTGPGARTGQHGATPAQVALPHVSAALQPFLHGHAPHFAHELHAFMAARLTVQAWDRAVRYVARPPWASGSPQQQLPHQGEQQQPPQQRGGGRSNRTRGWDVGPAAQAPAPSGRATGGRSAQLSLTAGTAAASGCLGGAVNTPGAGLINNTSASAQQLSSGLPGSGQDLAQAGHAAARGGQQQLPQGGHQGQGQEGVDLSRRRGSSRRKRSREARHSSRHSEHLEAGDREQTTCARSRSRSSSTGCSDRHTEWPASHRLTSSSADQRPAKQSRRRSSHDPREQPEEHHHTSRRSPAHQAPEPRRWGAGGIRRRWAGSVTDKHHADTEEERWPLMQGGGEVAVEGDDDGTLFDNGTLSRDLSVRSQLADHGRRSSYEGRRDTGRGVMRERVSDPEQGGGQLQGRGSRRGGGAGGEGDDRWALMQ